MPPTDRPVISAGAFGVGTFSRHAETFAGAVVGETVHDLRPIIGGDGSVRAILDDWDAAIDAITEILPRLGEGLALDAVVPLAPVQPVGQILCAGANYRLHVEQIVQSSLRNAGDPRSDEDLRAFAVESVERQAQSDPFMFVGAPGAVSGARDDVVLWTPGEQHDWELELGVVMKAAAHRISPDQAFTHIAGYVMSNDITVRDVMARPNIPLTDFVTSKNRPTFFPTGPFILPARFVADYRRLQITLKVNGEIMQDDSVSDIIHGVEECVSYASHSTILSAGDMILTGSPAGNAGKHGNRWLRAGDVMEASITGLGTQVTRCVAPPQ
jgi:2,4-didehydro-3-deoxy-L-rhamnonate hydrolase